MPSVEGGDGRGVMKRLEADGLERLDSSSGPWVQTDRECHVGQHGWFFFKSLLLMDSWLYQNSYHELSEIIVEKKNRHEKFNQSKIEFFKLRNCALGSIRLGICWFN